MESEILSRRVLKDRLRIRMEELTGTSITASIALVFLSPSMNSIKINPTNNNIITATEAGKDTLLRPMRESTPKQISRMMVIPKGMNNQEVILRRMLALWTWNFVRWIFIPSLENIHQYKSVPEVDTKSLNRTFGRHLLGPYAHQLWLVLTMEKLQRDC